MIRGQRSGANQIVANVLRLAKIAFATAAIVLVVIDGGSCVLTQMSVTDRVKEAGLTAYHAVENQPLTPQTVERAYQSAQQVASTSTATIVAEGPQGFSMGRDGSVTLTMHRTAPTLLLHRIGALKDHANASATWTQRPVHY